MGHDRKFIQLTSLNEQRVTTCRLNVESGNYEIMLVICMSFAKQ